MSIHSGMTMADLTPDALARLEAKLVADLDMVRKVRALLEEHPMSASAPVAAPAPAQTTPALPKPAVPPRPREEVLMEGLLGMAGRPFARQDFSAKVKAATGRFPDDKEVKTFLSRMLRKGSLVVHQERKGRPGHLYRSLLPAPEPAATTEAAAD